MDKKRQTTTHNLALCMVLIGVFFIAHETFAEASVREIVREQKREVIKEKIQDVKEIQENTKGLLEQAKNMIKEKIKKQLKGQLVTISGSTLTVKKDEELYTVFVTESTELKRKFGASSTLNEFSPQDTLLVIGKRTKNSDGTFSSSDIEASYIRNMSIQRRFTVFTGEVTGKTSNTLTLTTVGRGIQTVYISSNTQLKEKNRTISLADIELGNKIVVKGELWDRASNKIDAKMILKLNFQKPTPSVTKVPEND
jgi:hypothetical protein